jgi:hypothetical protein
MSNIMRNIMSNICYTSSYKYIMYCYNLCIHAVCSPPRNNRMIKSLQLWRAEHVVRVRETGQAYKIPEGNPEVVSHRQYRD